MNQEDKDMFFSAIGVNSDAKHDEIKVAMKTYCKKNHPDVNPNSPANFSTIMNLYQQFKNGTIDTKSSSHKKHTCTCKTPCKKTNQKSNWTDSQWDTWFDDEFSERAQTHGTEFASSLGEFERTQPRKAFYKLKKATFGALAGGTLSFGFAELVRMTGPDLIRAVDEIVVALRLMGVVGITAFMILPFIMLWIDSGEYAHFMINKDKGNTK